MAKRNIRVFVSSPGDLRPEREIVSEEVAKFGALGTVEQRYSFSCYRYEERVPAMIGDNAQKTVDKEMMRAKDADIVVCMFWARFGTDMPDFNPDTREPYGSGTEYEFYDAYRELRSRRRMFWRRQKPILLLYRKTNAAPEGADPVQADRVERFFKRFSPPHPQLEGIYKTFKTDAEVREILRVDFDGVLAAWDRPTERALEVVRPLLPLAPFIIALVIALLVIFAPKPLTIAPFNIALAGFVAEPGADVSEADASLLSQAFYTDFTVKLSEVQNELPLTVAVWAPKDVGAVQGTTVEARAQNAQALVDRLMRDKNAPADLVIYGTIRKENNRILVQPEFYLHEKYAETSEVLGRFGMEDALVTRSKEQTLALSSELSSRSKTLAAVTQGLVQMILQQYDEAYKSFSTLLPADVKDAKPGDELLYIMRGNAALMNYNKLVVSKDPKQQRRLEPLIQNAVDDYTAAATVNPDYARAQVGKGGVLYLRTVVPLGTDEDYTRIKDADIAGIEQAFKAALTAKDQKSADIPIKAEFGLAQVSMLRFLKGDPSSATLARQQFEAVIKEYGTLAAPLNPRVRELAAQSYGFLGVIARRQNDFASASTDYARALSLTELDTREEIFRRAVMDVSFEQNRASRQYDAAAAAYSEILTGKRADGSPTTITGEEAAARLYHLGKMMSEAGRPMDAIAAYRAGVTTDLSADPGLAASLYTLLGDKYYELYSGANATKDGSLLQQSTDAYRTALALQTDPALRAVLEKLIGENAAEGQTPGTEPAPTSPALVATSQPTVQ